MAVEIPPEVADFLDCCGVRYPDIDEGDVRGLAVKVRNFATNTRGPFGSVVHENSAAIAAYERLVATWAGASGDHQAELDRICAMIAKALDAVAYVITVTKAVVLTELAALATTYAAMTATPAARVTGPLVTGAARRLCVQMERALIGYLVVEVIAKAIEPLGRSIDKMLTWPAPDGAATTVRTDDPQRPTEISAENPPAPTASGTEELQRSTVTGVESSQVLSVTGVEGSQSRTVTGVENSQRSTVIGVENPQAPTVAGDGDSQSPTATGPEGSQRSNMTGVDESQSLTATSTDDAVPTTHDSRTVYRPVPGDQDGPRGHQPLGPSRSRGFVTPWAHAVRASAQRASFSKALPPKAFQSLDRRATTARKPRETPWSKLRNSEAASKELASIATVPTVRRRDRAGEPGQD